MALKVTSVAFFPPLYQSPSSEPDEENDPDGGFVFRRRAGCHYLAVSLMLIEINLLIMKSFHYSDTQACVTGEDLIKRTNRHTNATRVK